MAPRSADGDEALRRAVKRADDDRPFLDALRALGRRADRAAAGATCRACGACCHFDRAGHRLYLSIGELALLASAPAPRPQQLARGRCPYQVAARCAARRRRPLGCRTYFCESPDRQAAQDRHERLHAAVRGLHEAFGVPYRYVELTAALSGLGPAGLSSPGRAPAATRP
jgi:Fe-S-cluster containining protein